MYMCPVCGFDGLDEPPYGRDGIGSYEICPCCFFEFGFDDQSEGVTYAEWRTRWIRDGLPWRSSATRPPENWDPREQLARLTTDAGS